MYQPYTYLIAWTDHNVFYYGVRWSSTIEGKTPEQDLWVDYFTSSKYVHEFREEHGEPDRIEVRKVFDSADRALEWEMKFLNKIKAIDNQNFLNQSCGNGVWKRRKGHNHSIKTRNKISRSLKGRKLSNETKRKLSEVRLGKKLGPFTEEHKANISKALKGRNNWWNDKVNKNKDKIEKTRQKHLGSKRTEKTRRRISESKKGLTPKNKGSIWIHNPLSSEQRMINKIDIDEYLKLGFKRGSGMSWYTSKVSGEHKQFFLGKTPDENWTKGRICK